MSHEKTVVIQQSVDQVSVSEGEQKSVNIQTGAPNTLNVPTPSRDELVIKTIDGPGYLAIQASNPAQLTIQTGNAFSGGSSGFLSARKVGRGHGDKFKFMYVGYSSPADALVSDAAWKIYRYDTTTEVKTWADGDENYDNIWDSTGGSHDPTYENLTYS